VQCAFEAEKTHRAHAIVEQVVADIKGGALAHAPSGHFAANGVWLVLAAIAFNLTRAAGTIASVFHAKATTATIRRQLTAVPGRLATSARRLVIHQPKDWPWQDSWEGLFNTVYGPPPQQRPDHRAPTGATRLGRQDMTLAIQVTGTGLTSDGRTVTTPRETFGSKFRAITYGELGVITVSGGRSPEWTPVSQRHKRPGHRLMTCCLVVARGGVEPPTFRFSVGVAGSPGSLQHVDHEPLSVARSSLLAGSSDLTCSRPAARIYSQNS